MGDTAQFFSITLTNSFSYEQYQIIQSIHNYVVIVQILNFDFSITIEICISILPVSILVQIIF